MPVFQNLMPREEAPLRKLLKRRVTRREWKLRLRIAEGILNSGSGTKGSLPSESHRYGVNSSSTPTESQGIRVYAV